MSNFNELQSYLLAILGDPYDELRWSEGLLEQALRSALVEFSFFGAEREALFTVTTAGYEQDLSTLNARRILTISWPSDDGYAWDKAWVDFRMVDEHTVRFDEWEVTAGEVLRVRYAPTHTVNGLDGATTTTLYAREEHSFLLLAASKACDLRARRLLASGGDKSYVAIFRSLSNEYLAEFHSSDSEPTVLSWGKYYDL
jgi:hypothetical protein